MPSGDRTGPLGEGEKTGRGAGYCNSFTVPGMFNRGVNRGRGGRGLGIGLAQGGLGLGRRRVTPVDSGINPVPSDSIWSDGPPD